MRLPSLDSDSSLSLPPVRETAAVIIDGKMFPSSQLSVRQAVLCAGKLLFGLRGTGNEDEDEDEAPKKLPA